MLYSILIYGDETLHDRQPEPERRAILEQHRTFQATHRASGRMGPVARLMKTSTAVTLRQDGGAVVVLDGPFAETKEQLLGFYLLECASLDEAIEAAKFLPIGAAALEVRPVGWYGAGPLRPEGHD